MRLPDGATDPRIWLQSNRWTFSRLECQDMTSSVRSFKGKGLIFQFVSDVRQGLGLLPELSITLWS